MRDLAHRRPELLAAHLLTQPLRGVLVRADPPDSVELRSAAARLILPEGAACAEPPSAWLYGFHARPFGTHRLVPAVECVVPGAGAAMALEWAVAEVIGVRPAITRRAW